MAEPTPVILAKEGVSDDSFLFTETLKAEGEIAEEGECIARVETSKASVDINAPCRGHVFFRYRKGVEIPVGETIAVISQDATYAGALAPGNGAPAPAAAAPVAMAAATSASPSPTAPDEADPLRTRFTPLARKMMSEFNLDESRFQGGGLVKKETVMEAMRSGGAAPEGVPPVPAGTPARFSQAALAEAGKLGLAPESFTGFGLVTREDVLKRAGKSTAAASVAAPASFASLPGASAPAGLQAGSREATPQGLEQPGERIPLSKAKRNEIAFLTEGQRGALSSAISILVAGRGYFNPSTLAPLGDLLPILVYEASRLLRKFPDFNGCFDGDAVNQWARVNVGVAFEIDSGLKVPIIKDADTLAVARIKETIEDHVMKYLENRLGMEDLSGGTFTVTDLSGEKVFSFLPLINRRQSAILGIGGCQGFSEGVSAFPLTLTFDHRVSTGRKASEFLRLLKERLESYGPVLSPAAGSSAAGKSCAQCRRSESELRDRQYLLAVHRRGKPDFVCSQCMKGW